MPGMVWEHAGEARSALHAIVTDPGHGVAALSDPRTMSNLLTDLLPGAPREKAILVAAVQAGLADTLRGHIAAGMDGNTAVRLTSSAWSAIAPFTPEACDWVTAEFAIAMGVSVPGGGAAGAAAGAGPPGQVTRPPLSPGDEDPSYQPTELAGAPPTVRHGQAAGSSAETAAAPGWQPEPDGTQSPARRRRGAVALIVAMVVVAAAGVTAWAILASGSGAGRSGKESFVATSSYPAGSPLAISLVGVFTASGTETRTGRDRLLVRLPGGTFVGITRPRKASSSVDSGTCVLTITQPGTFTTGHGTGKYAGIAGSGSYHLVYTATFRRTSNGTCQTSGSSAPLPGSVTWAVHGTGPVKLP